MKILYIGQYTDGTTSKMRADTIKRISQPNIFDIIDTNIPFFDTPHIWRTVGFRFKKGPLIKKINSYVLSRLNAFNSKTKYNLIWIDKGVFLRPDVIATLKKKTAQIVHFTPDMAFYENKSPFFQKSISLYDFLITTKSNERELYLKEIEANKLIMTTQGFDSNIHCNLTEFEKKLDAVSFVGLWEPYREQVILNLIDNNIKIMLAGKGWKRFVKQNKHNLNLEFYGDGLFSHEYAKFISSTKLGLGLMSKRFPELHTTRTFEIPACGTALLTEYNSETSTFFTKDEVIFYNDIEDVNRKIKFYLYNPEALKKITEKGYKKVRTDNYDYESILASIITKIKV